MDSPKVLLWGTFDLGKPRTRILLKVLKDAGVPLVVQHVGVWEGVEDKSQLSGFLKKLTYVVRYSIAVVKLWWMYLRAPDHDVVLIGYFGHFDVLAFRPLRWIFRKPVVWDAFLSLYDTVVLDRKMVVETSLAAKTLRLLEKLACGSADLVVLDTAAHADRFERLYSLNKANLSHVPVGAESESFPVLPSKIRKADEPLEILFYGQFIPLHGINVILEAATKARDRNWRWNLIGTGQDAPRIRNLLTDDPMPNVIWTEWVAYERLTDEIAGADICLGVFGESEKAASVVPNKVYQIIASGRPLITLDSPAIRQLIPEALDGVCFIPARDPDALITAIEALDEWLQHGDGKVPAYDTVRARFSDLEISRQWLDIIDTAASHREEN